MKYTFNFSGKFNFNDSFLTKTTFINSDFTAQCWIKTTKSGTILSKQTKESNLILKIASNGALVFQVKLGENTQVIQSENIVITDGKWKHVTAVKTANFLSLYLNGKQIETIENTTKIEETVIDTNFAIGGNTNKDFFTGKISQVIIWKKGLLAHEIKTSIQQIISGNEDGLLTIFSQEEKDTVAITDSVENDKISVTLCIKNNSFEALTLQDSKSSNFPNQLAIGEKVTVQIESNKKPVINEKVTYKNKSGSTVITIKKNLNKYDTLITAVCNKDLVDDLSIKENEDTITKGDLVIGENMVVVNLRNVYNFLNELRGHLKCDQIQTPEGNLIDAINYNNASLVFNRRFQLKPYAIIYCESTEDVQRVYKGAIANNLPVRVRSGGHDHEGECSGTDTILIDLSRIHHVFVNKDKMIARIGPGTRFKDLTPKLAKKSVMIPHGTCATVGIAGFTFGGGWGPWTREHGMNCEGLVGATIVLGNGEIKKLTTGTEEEHDLLWALKGGGGMSYGIITELELKVFSLPEELLKFELEWNLYDEDDASVFEEKTPTIQVLNAWENVIKNKEDEFSTDDFKNKQLIGTNLKVSGKHLEGEEKNFKAIDEKHNCIMYGYWSGNEESLKAFVRYCFATALPKELRIVGKGGTGEQSNYDHSLMSAWDRESFTAIKRKVEFLDSTMPKATMNHEETYEKIYKIEEMMPTSKLLATTNIFTPSQVRKPIPPDLDAPAPHKITSRFADKGGLFGEDGLQNEGAKQLITSLTSKLIQKDSRTLGLFSYITLGAIVGSFYKSMSDKDKNKSAFPYKDCAYTIQYQTWWNNTLEEKELEENNDVYNRTNRALDWMQQARDYKIENTGGSFISFKDSSIPTETYFGNSYEDLIKAKKDFSEDPLNHLRTRKTII